MLNFPKQNLKLLSISIYSKNILITPASQTLKLSSQICIQRGDQMKIQEIHQLCIQIAEINQKTSEQPQVTKQISFLAGIFQAAEQKFIVYVDECTQVASILETAFYRIESVGFIEINANQNKKNKNYIPVLQSLKKLLQYGFYFSIGRDITVTRQSTEKCDTRFVWNSFLMKDFLLFQISEQWTLPILQGFVSMSSVLVNTQKVETILISRRSKYQSGTRYNARGIDDDGNAANFVETEQIIIFGSFLCSHVGVRGSVPVFWNIEGINYSIKRTRSNELTNTAFVKHFNTLKNKYEKVFCVNLMTNTRTQEQQLTDIYEQMIKWNNMNFVRYEFVDFQQICHGTKFEAINPTIRKYNSILESFSFYCENLINKKPLQFQRGVFRINCFDCLDRTNAFMTKLFFAVAEHILLNLGVDIKQNQVVDALSLLDLKSQNDFVFQYKNQWADNGDCISTFYSGSKSAVSEITREGQSVIKNLLSSGMKTLERFYNYSFEDQGKQKSINYLLYGMQTEGQYNEYEVYLKSQERQFCTYDQVSVMIVTWNVGAKEPINKNMRDSLFNFEQNKPPDLLVCGVQEIVDLNTQNLMLFNNDKAVNSWNQLIAANLAAIDSYIQVASTNMVGIYLCLYAKRSLIKRISQIETDTVKTGLGGTLGNKGAALLKMQIDDTQIVFMNCHLSAGHRKMNERLQDISDIHEKNSLKVVKADFKFLFGDLNARVDSNYFNVISMITYYQTLMDQNQYKQAAEVFYQMHDMDQLAKVRLKDYYLSKYQEGGITFLPTYKFDQGTNTYDTSKKQRVPSWCDRILLSCNDGCTFQQLYYNRRELNLSDHKPVSSYFILEIKKVEKVKLEEVKNGFAQVQKQSQFEDESDSLGQNGFIPEEVIFDPKNEQLSKNNARSLSTPKNMAATCFQKQKDLVNHQMTQPHKTQKQHLKQQLPSPESLIRSNQHPFSYDMLTKTVAVESASFNFSQQKKALDLL